MTACNGANAQRFFAIGAEDIAANRAGHLGPHQRRSHRVTLLVWSLILSGWLAAMGFAIAIQLDGESWHGMANFIASIVFIVLVAVVPVLIIVDTLRWLSPTLVVSCLTGVVSVGNGYLTVGERHLGIPCPYNGRGGRGASLGPWIDEALSYDVYTARGRAISLVPIGAAPSQRCADTVTQGDANANALLGIMGIGPEDIAANRIGKLGPRQRRNQRKRGFGFLATGLALDTLLLYSGFISNLQEDPDAIANWLAPLILGILVGGFFTWVGIVVLRESSKDLDVRCVTGPVSVYVQGIGPHQGAALKMRVGDDVFALPLSLLSKDERYEQALTSRAYHVYVRGRTAVGIEPA